MVHTIAKLRHVDRDSPGERLLFNCEWTINHALNRMAQIFLGKLWSATSEEVQRVNKCLRAIKDANKTRKRYRWKLKVFCEKERVWVFNIAAKNNNRLHKLQPKWSEPVYIEKRLFFLVCLIKIGNGVREKVHADFIKPFF